MSDESSAIAEESGSVPGPAAAVPDPAFVDFGCGNGASMKFAQSVMQGAGIGIDRSAEAVAAARARGFDAEQADILDYEHRNVAAAAFALDVLPEVGPRQAFEKAWINVVRAARDHAMIQHLCFDSEDVLRHRGLHVPALRGKTIQFMPRISDYLWMLGTYGQRLNVSGMAIFGAGEPATEALPIAQFDRLPGAAIVPPQPVFRSIRVIIGRKDTGRFRAALKRFATGDALVIWQRPG